MNEHWRARARVCWPYDWLGNVACDEMLIESNLTHSCFYVDVKYMYIVYCIYSETEPVYGCVHEMRYVTLEFDVKSNTYEPATNTKISNRFSTRKYLDEKFAADHCITEHVKLTRKRQKKTHENLVERFSRHKSKLEMKKYKKKENKSMLVWLVRSCHGTALDSTLQIWHDWRNVMRGTAIIYSSRSKYLFWMRVAWWAYTRAAHTHTHSITYTFMWESAHVYVRNVCASICYATYPPMHTRDERYSFISCNTQSYVERIYVWIWILTSMLHVRLTWQRRGKSWVYVSKKALHVRTSNTHGHMRQCACRMLISACAIYYNIVHTDTQTSRISFLFGKYLRRSTHAYRTIWTNMPCARNLNGKRRCEFHHNL